MEYTIALIIHLFCAIIFIGFVFADVIVLPAMKKVLSEEEHQKVMNAVSSRARMIFPPSVLLLLITGGYMMTNFMNDSVSSTFHMLLGIKILLALIIVSGIIYSLSRKLLKKTPHPIMKHFHKFVLVCGIIIIILAKLMFIF